MFSSITIGDGGDYDTISLWQQARRNNIPADKQVDDELTLLSGVHSAGGFLTYWPTDEEVTINVVIQAHPSALHNGDWDSGACLSGQATQNWKVRNNDLNITYRDLVLKKTQVQFDQGNNYFGSIRGTDWDMSAIHPGSLTFERCLMYTEGVPHTRMHYMSYVPSSSPSAFGTLEVNYNNCVLEDIYGPVYPNYSQIVPAYYSTSGDHTYNFRGCTLSRQSFGGTTYLTGGTGSENPNGSLTINVSGCIEDTSAAAQPTLVAGHAINLGYYPGGVGFPSNLSATLIDHITNQASGSVYDWATTKTNVSYAVPLTFDGTVSSNQVGFVDNQGASSFRDYRLVADFDNLPVQYIDTAELPNRDVAKVLRPGLRDAGAFQSISTSSLEYRIGTSAIDFEPDYATMQLWRGSSDYNLPVLNGMTTKFILGAEEMKPNLHYRSDGVRDVNQSFIFEGFKPHEGNWTSGTRIHVSASDPSYNFARQIARFDLNNNEIDVTMKDFVVSSQIGSTLNMVTLNARNLFNPPYTNNYAPSSSVTIRNMLISFEDHEGYIAASDYREVELDSEGNIVERAEITSNIENSLIVQKGFTTRACNLHRSLNSINAQHNVNVKGCTLINTQIPNFGLASFDNQMKVSVVGSLIHNDANQLSENNRLQWLGRSGSYVSGSVTDTIFSFVSGSVAEQANQSTTLDPSAVNTSYDTVFNFDGSVSAGTVSFESSATKDYRLVADLDNLPVKYMTSGELSYKDITGYKRPGGTDQRDAGAFQSISDKVTIKNIGTSSADFTPDYATPALWLSNYYDNANILNGETNVLRLKNGEEHSFGMNLRLDGDADVNQSFIFSGQSPHYGNLDSAAKAGVYRGNPAYAFIQSLSFYPYKNSANITYESIGLDTQTSSTNYRSHGQDYFLRWVGGTSTDERKQVAPEYNITYNRCIFNYDVSNAITIARYNVYEALEDSDGNILERAQINIKANNSIFKGRGNVSGSPSVHGYLYLGDNQLDTPAQMNVDYRGCTFVNSQVGNGRFGGDNFSMSAIGCLIYIPEDSHNSWGSWPAAFVPEAVTNSDLDKVILKDCITSQRSDHFVLSRFNRDYFPQYSQEASSVFTNTNMRYEIPFNLDGTVSAGTVSFVSADANDYRLVADQDNLAVQYMNVSNTSNYDLAGRRRPGLTDAGAFQSHSDAILSSIIGSGVDGVSADHATVALFYAASGDSIVNGQTFDLVFQNQEHDFIVNIGTNPLLEVDQKWIVRGDVSHGGKWDNGARFIETGLLTNQVWWGGVFQLLGKQDVIFEMKDIVLSSNIFHTNWGWFNAARVIEDAAHDCTYTFDRCLISIVRDLGWPYPNLVAYNSGTGEQGLTTVNILNTVVSGNTTPGSRNSLISPYFTQNPAASHGGKGNTAHNFVGSTFYNRRGGHITLQNNDCNISGCIIVSRGSNAERFLGGGASTRNISAVDNIFSNSQSYEEYYLGTNHTNCTFDVDFYYDNEDHDGSVTFIGSALDAPGPLDFRLGGDPRVRTNLAEDYVTNAVLSNRDAASRLRDLGRAAAGAFEYNPELLKAIILDAIPKYTIGYRININR